MDHCCDIDYIFHSQGATNIANALLPNSIFQALIAMIGFLAADASLSIHMRYITQLPEPTSLSALASYMVLILGAILRTLQYFLKSFGISWILSSYFYCNF